MPGRLMSYVYLARPATLSGPSSRLTAVPSTAGFSGHKYLSGTRSAGGCWPRPPPPCGFSLLRTSHPPRLHRRFHDSCECAAAADVAVEALSRLFGGGVRMLLEKRDRRHHEAWRADAARPAVAHALVPDEIGPLPQRVEQGDARLDPQIDALAVHHQLDRHFAGPDSARTGAGLGVGFCHAAGHGGGEAADAGRLQEVA